MWTMGQGGAENVLMASKRTWESIDATVTQRLCGAGKLP